MPNKRGKYKDTDRMRSDMMKVYNEVYSSCWSQREAWEKTIHHKAPRFYISPKQAYEVLRPMFFCHDFSLVNSMKPTRKRLYEALYEIVKDMTQKREFIGKSLWHICKYAVMQEAPEFFVDWEAMRKIFRWQKALPSRRVKSDDYGVQESKGH